MLFPERLCYSKVRRGAKFQHSFNCYYFKERKKMSSKKKHRKTYLKRIQEFRLMDDAFMAKCFENNVECTELVLGIVLEREDLTVQKVETQHLIKNLQGRSVILDIYAVDTVGKKYNIEVQRANKGATAKRARYHSSLLDANITEPGDGMEKLAETYVIFITEKDVYARGLPLYHVERVITETAERFGDEAHIVYVNGAYRGADPIGLLMHDFCCVDPEKMQYKVLAERVRYFKENRKGGNKMKSVMDELRKEGEYEGRMNERWRMASALLQEGILSFEQIARVSQLSMENIEKLAMRKGLRNK